MLLTMFIIGILLLIIGILILQVTDWEGNFLGAMSLVIGGLLFLVPTMVVVSDGISYQYTKEDYPKEIATYEDKIKNLESTIKAKDRIIYSKDSTIYSLEYEIKLFNLTPEEIATYKSIKEKIDK